MKARKCTVVLMAALCMITGLTACDEGSGQSQSGAPRTSLTAEVLAEQSKAPIQPGTQMAEECSNPEMDLMETALGYHLAAGRVAVDTRAESGKPLVAELRLKDNQFDPCAQYSYVELQAVVSEADKYEPMAWEAPYSTLVFFHGENLIKDQQPRLSTPLDNIELSGDELTAERGIFEHSYVKPTGAKSISYLLSPTRAFSTTDDGAEVYQTHTLDLERKGPPSDIMNHLPEGNRNHNPWDFEEDWDLPAAYSIPLGDGAMICVDNSPSSYHVVDRLTCSVDGEPAWPSVDTLDVGRDKGTDQNGKTNTAAIRFFTPPHIYTYYSRPLRVDDVLDVPDESVSRFGNVVIDTRGDSAVITDYLGAFAFDLTTVREVETPSFDKSAWPTGLREFKE